MYMCVCSCLYVHTACCVLTQVCVLYSALCSQVPTCMCVCMRVCMDVMYGCMYVCMYRDRYSEQGERTNERTDGRTGRRADRQTERVFVSCEMFHPCRSYQNVFYSPHTTGTCTCTCTCTYIIHVHTDTQVLCSTLPTCMYSAYSPNWLPSPTPRALLRRCNPPLNPHRRNRMPCSALPCPVGMYVCNVCMYAARSRVE